MVQPVLFADGETQRHHTTVVLALEGVFALTARHFQGELGGIENTSCNERRNCKKKSTECLKNAKRRNIMLKGKIAVVTGGTRGIGYAIVKKYLENGAKVILFGSRQETVDKALASLKEENPEWEVSGACPSLTDAKEVADEIQAIHRKYGKIDILVNNAGVSDSMMTIDCNPEHFQEIINLNVNAVFNAIQPSVELMKEQGGGCIINTSSMVSKYGQPGGVAYPTSKFGVNGLTISLARELGQYGIRVNAVAPGITRTDMVAALPEEEIQPLIATIPLGRIGEPEDVANACLFLASELASYVSGEILAVDGATIC